MIGVTHLAVVFNHFDICMKDSKNYEVIVKNQLSSSQLKKLDDNVILDHEPTKFLNKDIGSTGSLYDGEEKKDISKEDLEVAMGAYSVVIYYPMLHEWF